MQPYPVAPPPMHQPPKKGMSTLTVLLIVFGILAVLGIGTCAIGALVVTHEVSEVAKSMEGGLVMAAPANVVADLAGPKKDYVGTWRSKKGSMLTIGADGNMKLEKDEDGDGNKETITAPIAAFAGDDIQVQMFVTLTVKVTSAPTLSGDHWEMIADGIHFERKK